MKGGGFSSERYFPSFSEGLSLRAPSSSAPATLSCYFPSFSEGLSLRATARLMELRSAANFPSFSEGLSLRAAIVQVLVAGQ